MSLCSRHETYLAKAASMPDAEDQSMMGRFVRVERQVRIRMAKHLVMMFYQMIYRKGHKDWVPQIARWLEF